MVPGSAQTDMSHTVRRRRSSLGPEWRLRHRAARTDWSDTTEGCACCNRTVDMRNDHYQMVLDREIDGPGKIGIERERVVFCDETCADAWLSN